MINISLIIMFMERNLTHLSMSTTLWKHKIWLEWLINSMISKKANMHLTSANHLVQVSAETIIGPNRQTVEKWSLVFQVRVLLMPRNYFMLPLVVSKKTHKLHKCIEKHMVISLLENKSREIITGDSNLQITSSVTARRKSWTVLKPHFNKKETMRDSQEQ